MLRRSSNSLKGSSHRTIKTFWIHPRYQLKVMAWIGLPALFLAMFNGYLFYKYVSENYAILVELSPMTDDAKQVLYGELSHIVATLSVSSVVFVLAVCLLSLFFSHKTAGPLRRLDSAFHSVRDGRLDTRIHFRDGDHFAGIAKSFNNMMDAVQKKG